MDRIDLRTLNRATMTRQWLAERQPRSAAEAIAHLVGVQAQEPHEPYPALWSRLAGFAPAELVELLESRGAVRTLMMRRTLHLLTGDDCRSMRPVFDQMLVQRARGTLGSRLPGLDWDELATLGEPLFAEQPRMLSDVGRAVAHRFPDAPVRDLGDALRSLVPLAQVPPRGLWGIKAPALNTTISAWLGDDPVPETSPEAPGAALPRGVRPGSER